MNYTKLFEKAWGIVWNNKFLIFLGVLVSLGGWGGNSGTGNGGNEGNVFFSNPLQILSNVSALFEGNDLPVRAMLVGGLLILVGVVFWLLSTVARGGLIFAADRINKGHPTSFAESFRAGWENGWRLIGIGIIPLIPMLLLMASAFTAFGIYNTRSVVFPGQTGAYYPNAAVIIPIVAVLLFLSLGLSILRTFANRACMLEGQGVFGAYRRALAVIGENLGPALGLFLIQIVISIGIWLVLFLPGILIALCCILWPLLIVFQGAFAAFYSTLWTLAWTQWTSGVEEASTIEM